MNHRLKIAIGAIGIVLFLFYFFVFEGVGLDYWDTYIAAPATFVAGKPCMFVDEQGRPSYDPQLRGRLPHDLVDNQTYGIVSKDQRIGGGVTFAPAYRAFGTLGFRIHYAAFGMLAFLLSWMMGRRMFSGQALPVLLGLIVAVNPFLFSMNRLNANFISVPILMGLMVLLLEEKPKWAVAGLVYGALGGIRNEAIVLVPALCLLMLSSKGGRKGILWFGAGSLTGISPYLVWNKFAFGKALIHASQFSDFQGFRPMFPHRLFGWEFEFNGLFNWPFHDHLVRTPHYPFPTYFTLPLTLISCFGVLLFAFALVGLVAQLRKNRVVFGFLTLWIFFCLGLFLFQENWEEPKTTFGALAIVPLAVFMVRGIEWIVDRPKSLVRWGSLACVVLVLKVAVFSVSYLSVPVDERWYVRFPKAKTEAPRIGCLSDEQRREWMFFHTDECDEELAVQSRKLTRGNLLPRPFYPLRFHLPNPEEKWGGYTPEIFDIWEKIYGY